MKILRSLLGLLFTVVLTQNAYSHSVQVGYCTSCTGDVRIWVEHWHGNEDPNGTSMTLDVTVNGVITSYTGVPNTSVLNTSVNNLSCASTITIFGSCSDANTYNDWVAYDFPSLPTNVPIDITVVAGHTVFTEDGCNMYPASTGIIIIPPPPSYTDVFECLDENGTVASIPTTTNSNWTNDNPGIGLAASGTGDIPAFTPPANPAGHVANITVSNTCGTSTFVLTVNPAPDANFVTAGAPGDPLCLGETSVFTDNSSPIQSSNLVAWNWDFGDGSPPVGTQNPTHVYTQPGQYDVSLTVTDANTCTNNYILNVFISPIPVADFNVDSLCFGMNSGIVDLSTVDNTHGDNITSWLWDFGDGQTSSNATPTHQYGSEDLYNISLTVTSNNGCVNSITKTTAIYPIPVPDFTATTECLGFTTDFVDQSTVSNAHTSNAIVDWAWVFGDGNSGSTQNTSNDYVASGIYNSELTITTDNGCTASLVVPVTVYEPPVASFNFTNACDDEDVLLASTSIANASGNLNYFWDVDNNNTTDYNIDPVTHTYNHDGFYDVRLVVENSNGCRDTITQEVTVYALPNASFVADAVCEDATTTFTNNSTIVPVDNDVINQYEWNFGNGTTSALENPTVNYGIENVYSAQLITTTNYGCKDTAVVSVSVYPLPIIDFTPTEVCLEFATHFQDQSTVSSAYTSNSNVSWDWDFADGNVSNVQNPVHTYLADGIYNTVLTVTTNNNCVNSKVIPVTVYPKPLASFVGVDLEGCSPVCPTITSTSTVNSPSSIVNYHWELTDGSVYEGSDPLFADCFYNETGVDITYGLTLTVTSDKGCVNDYFEPDYIVINHNPIADFYFTPDEPDVIDPVVDFHNTSLYADSYEWTFGYYSQSTDTNPIVEFPADSMSYATQLIAYTDKGCSDTVSGVVRILDRLIFYIPNTFTPDGDKFNETFQPVFTSGFDPQSYNLYIFNRWGEIVFESHDTSIGWDGTYGINGSGPVKNGAYIWKIDFKTSMNDERKKFQGHVNLLR